MNLICGINPVFEALLAGNRHFDRLLIAKGIRNRRISEILSRGSGMGVPLRFEAREALDRLAGGVPHQGIIAVVSAKPVIGLEELLAEARDPALLMVLDGVEDPRNLGAILRSAEAAGVDGVLLPERHSAGLSETVARASAGALEYVRIARVGNVAQSLEALKARGVWVVGFDASGSERWDAVDLKRPVALVLGGEGRGIRRLTRERCDHLVALPQFGHVSSLNVSVVAGIALYEAIRQRGATPSHVRPIPPRASASPPQVVGPPPDDAEHDPGHVGPRPQPEASGEEPEDDVPAVFVHLHEDEEAAAWAGPQLVKAEGARHDWHGGRHDKRREASPPASGAAGPERGPRSGPRGRRRSRRQGPPRSGAPAVPAPQGSPERPPPAGGPPRGQGRRRRRRRRGRGPGPPQRA